MFLVHIFICVPLSGKEWMFITYYFTIEEGDHLWVFVCEVFNLQVTTEVGILLVHVLQHHLHVVLVPLGLLVAGESGAIVQQTSADSGL